MDSNFLKRPLPHWTLIALGITGYFFILYPDFFFFTRSPMNGDKFAIQDASVSWAAFMPAWREFHYQFWENGNVLWSNLRGMGLPLLGNAVQAAPLFPLNLALIALPDSWYWTVMPLTRVVLIAFGCYAIARKLLHFPILISLIFALFIGFNLHIFRWINHATLNGILAGIWYVYFSCTVLYNAQARPRLAFLHTLGLTLASYSLVTCGFPEASMLGALLALFFTLGFLLQNWRTIAPHFGKSIGLLCVANFAGIALSAIQLFALLEFIFYSEALDLRKDFIHNTIEPRLFTEFLLNQVVHFTFTKQHIPFLNFSIGVAGLFFLICGVIFACLSKRQLWIKLSCLIMAALYLSKSFGVFASLEMLFAHLPILAQSHFPVYFSLLLFFPIGYFIAYGADNISAHTNPIKPAYITAILGFSACLSLFIAAIEAHTVEAMSFKQFILQPIILIALFAVAGLVLLQCFKPRARAFTLLLALIWVGAEVGISLPKNHASTSDFRLGLSNANTALQEQAINALPIPLHEVRGKSRLGEYAKLGLATLDNGISAILPPDQRYIRILLFNTQYGGYFPLKAPKKSWSHAALSTNFVSHHTTPKSQLDWSLYTQQPSLLPSNIPMRTLSLAKTPLIYFEGSVPTNIGVLNDIAIYIQFIGNTQTLEVEGNIAGHDILPEYHNTRWRVRIPSDWLDEDRYAVHVRAVNKQTKQYADLPFYNLKLQPKNGPSLTLVAAAEDLSEHIYLNQNALPRAYIAKSCQFESSQQGAHYLAHSNTILTGHISLNSVPKRNTTLCNTYSSELQKVHIKQDTGDALSFDSVQGPALLVLHDYFYPGWRAIDNVSGEALTILKANSIFRAIYLPENRTYNITMAYQPNWLTWVYALFWLALFALIATWFVLHRFASGATDEGDVD